MELKLSSPLYYRYIFGIDTDVAYFCRDICEYVKYRNYGTGDKTIYIEPIIVPKEILKHGFWPEKTNYKLKGKQIFVDKYIDYDKYLQGDLEERKKLMVGNILRCLKAVKTKSGVNYDIFESDLLNFLEYELSEIKKYMKVEKVKRIDITEGKLTALTINTPKYFRDKHETGNEVNMVCKKISNYIADKSYSSDINLIFVFPKAAPQEVLDRDLCLGSVQCVKESMYILVSTRIDYDKYVNGSEYERQMLLVINLLSGIKEVSDKCNFNYDDFEKDVFLAMEYDENEIKIIKALLLNSDI